MHAPKSIHNAQFVPILALLVPMPSFVWLQMRVRLYHRFAHSECAFHMTRFVNRMVCLINWLVGWLAGWSMVGCLLIFLTIFINDNKFVIIIYNYFHVRGCCVCVFAVNSKWYSRSHTPHYNTIYCQLSIQFDRKSLEITIFGQSLTHQHSIILPIDYWIETTNTQNHITKQIAKANVNWLAVANI